MYKGKFLNSDEERIIDLSADEIKNVYCGEECWNLTWSVALYCMKRGYRAKRKGWNGKGLYVKIYEPVLTVPLSETFFIIYDVDNNKRSTWVPSVSDNLANDWVIW